MALGCLVVLLFSLIFLFYTYSFLNRRRAREFGLYNVLGMGRRNISRIVLWESAITTAIALIGGLTLGAALSKLAELGMINLMNGEIDYRIQLDFKAVFRTVVCYVPVFVINALAAVIRTRRSSAVNLLKAENAGEKPPRSNWLLAILGVVILGVAYWMAVSIRNPLDALMWFFAALLLVIIATYMLLIAGSVWLCRRSGFHLHHRHDGTCDAVYDDLPADRDRGNHHEPCASGDQPSGMDERGIRDRR